MSRVAKNKLSKHFVPTVGDIVLIKNKHTKIIENIIIVKQVCDNNNIKISWLKGEKYKFTSLVASEYRRFLLVDDPEDEHEWILTK
jgi:hypothetical protein